MCDLFIFVGEHSADLHAEAFLKALKKKNPHLKIAAVAGPRMRAVGVDECLMPMENFQVMGFIDVVLALPRILKHFYTLKKQILALNPKACLFIDYPGFNLKMESSLKQAGYTGKLLHYISPTVWAWKKKRADLMEKTLDKLFVILPFEKEFFAPYKLPVEYVGHPLVERLLEFPTEPFPIDKEKKLIALFPGSRKKEIERNLPIYIQAFKKLKEENKELIAGISVADKNLQTLIQKILDDFELQESSAYKLYEAKDNYRLMKTARLCFAKSGTVTLELALLKTPTVITYAVSKLDVFIAQKIFKINLPFYGLANLLLQKEVFPELIGPHFSLDNLLAKANLLLREENQQKCTQNCEALIKLLGKQKASENLAESVLGLLNSK